MDENVFNFIREVDDLGHYDVEEDPMAGASSSIPRGSNLYLRDIVDPFSFYTDDDFADRYRFRKGTVMNVIVPLIHGLHHSTMRGLPIPVELQVTIALRFYATGSIQLVCGDLHYVSQPTVSRIVKYISTQLAGRVEQFVAFPEALQAVSERFGDLPHSRYPGLRHIIGAIDCTHVKIRRPRGIEHSETYRNRKGYFSINVQVIVGPNMKIFDIVARWPGSSHDSRIFRSSRVHAKLESGQLQGILVGDSGYRAATYMLTPVVNPTTQAQTRYNYVQVRTRNVVERFYGVWKQRYACLRVGLNTKLSTTANIIVACAVLHNISVNCNEELIVDGSYTEEDIAHPTPHNAASGLAFRSQIIESNYNY